jgi:dienelactone hydrolase
MRLTALHPLVGFCACLAAPTLALPVRATLAAETYRVLLPAVGTLQTAVLLVPGCSGFTARTGFNLYEERAAQLQAAGYYVVFVDYLTRRHLKDCAGGRDVSHAEVGKDILEAAVWASGQLSIASGRIFVIGWSYGGGGVLAALATMSPGLPPISKAVMYYPDCRRAKPWSSAGVAALMLMGAMDEVALPGLCDVVIKGAPPNTVHAVLYPGARHGFDVRTLPERAEYGRIGYNAEADQASWKAALEFLH